MSEKFDPYHTWLGIPEHEQPPDYYRLLGIARFEPDPEVIQNACDQRMAHLKGFSTGPHAVLSEKLLNEVSKAAVCLLNPQRKSSYDTALHNAQRQAEGQATTAEPRNQAALDEPSRSSTKAANSQILPHVSPLDTPSTSGSSTLAMRNWKTRKRRQRALFVVLQFVLAAPVGLAAGCGVLAVLYPDHPIIVRLKEFFSADEPGPISLPAPQENQPDRVQGQDSADDERRPADVAAVPTQTEPTDSNHEGTITPPSVPKAEPSHGSESAPPVADPVEQDHEITLSLDGTTRAFPLDEITDPSVACVRIESDGFPVFAKFDPPDQTVRKGYPLTIRIDRLGTAITFVLSMESDAKRTKLQVATPRIADLEAGQSAFFTQRWIRTKYNEIRPQALRAEKNLEELRKTRVDIQRLLQQPMNSQTRATTQGTLDSIDQAIAGQQQMVDHAQKLQALVELADELHNTRLKYTVLLENPDRDSSSL